MIKPQIYDLWQPVMLCTWLLALPACSSTTETWPSLADPLPDPADRQVAIERPVQRQVQETLAAPIIFENMAAAKHAFDAGVAEIRKGQKRFEDSIETLKAATPDDAQDAWGQCQLLLTQFSDARDRFERVALSPQLPERYSDKTRMILEAADGFMAAGRQFLSEFKP